MKIAIAGPVGCPGGLQTHFRELKAFLLKEGHEVMSVEVEVAPGGRRSLHSAEELIFISAGKGSFFKLRAWAKAILRVRRWEADLLIAVSNGFGYAALGLAAPKHCFSVRTEVVDSWRSGDFLHEISARIFAATAVQSPSLLIAQRSKISAGHPIAVLPCFAAISEGPHIASQPRGDRLRIAFFGRLAQNKGLIELLTAFMETSLTRNTSLDIWGDGPMVHELKELIQTGGMKDVALRGRYPDGTEGRMLMASYHGLVLPSQASEGLPLVLLEAASVGLPFLSCDVGAIRDTLIGNPDATIIPIGQQSLKTGLLGWLAELSAGKFLPERLKYWYSLHHSRASQESAWRRMLELKNGYFTR